MEIFINKNRLDDVSTENYIYWTPEFVHMGMLHNIHQFFLMHSTSCFCFFSFFSLIAQFVCFCESMCTCRRFKAHDFKFARLLLN